MRIIYIANARMPTEKAHGIQLAKMCEAFCEQGVSLTLLAPRRGDAPVPLREFYGLRSSIPLKKLPAPDTYGAGRIGFLFGSFVFMASYFFYCLFQKARGACDAIYTVDIDQFSFFLIPLLDIPYFVELHDAKPWSALYAWFLRNARGIIAVNSIIKKDIAAAFGIPEKNIIVCPNGIDMARFGKNVSKKEARASLGLPHNARIALYAGKFYAWKGLAVLIRAAQKLREGAIYIVGGDGDDLKKIAGVDDLPRSLICFGHRQYREIPMWLHAADVLLLLGTKENEYSRLHTSPMKLFEYLASRRPIVASRTPAIEDVVSEREVFFYEPDNAESLEAAIGRAYSAREAEEIRRKTESAFEKAQEFTWEERAKKIISFIRFSSSMEFPPVKI